MSKHTGIRQQRISLGFATAVFVALTIAATTARAEVARVPLIVGQSIPPNIFVVLDDSGSMHFEFMPANPITTEPMSVNYPGIYGYPAIPDDVYDEGDSGNKYTSVAYTTFENDVVNAYMRYWGTNRIYYNPAITYEPWVESTGTPMAPAAPAAAYWNPGKLAQGDKPDTYDLTTQKIDINAIWVHQGSDAMEPIDVDCDKEHDDDSCEAHKQSFWPMVYWIYQGPASALTDDGDDSEWDVTNYVKVELRGSKGSDNITITTPQDNDPDTSVDAAYIDTSATMATVQALTGYPTEAPDRTYDQAVQNFANWFTYYRSRNLLAKGSVGHAFVDQDEGVRVGFGAINALESSGSMELKVVPFDAAGRKQFYDTVYAFDNDRNNTPLRDALNELGKRLENKDYMWRSQPDDPNSGMPACRQNYVLFTTDGYWTNSNDPDGIGNEDGDNGQPFADTYSGTLADVAMYYWENDLRTDMDNTLATSTVDTANWQHLVTFTVGLGVYGTLPETALDDGNVNWPNPHSGNEQRKIDDLWHAAVNGRGKYFSATNVGQFTQALADSLKAINKREGAAASASTNTGLAINGAAVVYQPEYHSGDWYGDLLAYNFSTSSGLSSTPSIKAADVLDGQDWNIGREIITYSNHSGVAFRWNQLSTNQENNLNHGDGLGESRLKYLRGDRSLEGTAVSGFTFRTRTHVLGDLVHSTPVYIGAPGSLYNLFQGGLTNAEASSYITFRDTNASRTPMIYVGANDGMLHAFKAATLTESLAYVPASVYPNLFKLTESKYQHHYYVDSTPTVSDVYYSSSWHTVLVGATGAGGKALFALDITDPSQTNFDESNANNLLLWEISPDLDADATDGENKYADLGYTFSQPSIVRMHNGSWAAVYGNGYDSDKGNAVLYITDIQDGSLIQKIVLEGDTTDGLDNGLSSPVVADLDGDHIADRIYAGDLQGNLWAVDVTNPNQNQWGTAFGTASAPEPLFDGSPSQPITVRPIVVRNPAGGQVVLFGTGQFYETNDNQVGANAPTQSFYGIWDAQVSNVIRSQLQEQDITSLTYGSVRVRVVDNNPVDYSKQASNIVMGWYIDLDVVAHNGERVVRDPLLRAHKLILTTLIPSDNPCAGGGTGWLMEVDPVTGGRLAYSAFDLNADGTFSKTDYVQITQGSKTIKVPVSGLRPLSGVPSKPAVVVDPDTGNEIKFITGSLGTTVSVLNNAGDKGGYGRQSWHQLK